MTKKIINLFGCVFVSSMLIGAFLFASLYLVTESNFEQKEGILSKDIQLTQDEYGNNTSMRLSLQKNTREYILAGKLLELSSPTIYDLKKGDAVLLWVQKEASKNFFFKSISLNESIWGISLNDNTILSLNSAIKQRKSPSSLVYMSMFLMMALFTIRFIFKYNNPPHVHPKP